MDEIEFLGRLVEADAAASEPQTFTMIYTGGGREIIGHPGWPEGQKPGSDLQVDEMAHREWVRVQSQDGKGRIFAVTTSGREEWKRHQALAAGPTGTLVDLSWPAAKVLLATIYAEYVATGAPELGVEIASLVDGWSDSESGRALIRELARADYLEIVFENPFGPQIVRPTRRTLQLEAGWPAGDAEHALSALVEALDAEIDRSENSERRSKLKQVRDGVLGVARDVTLAYLEKQIGL